jgi:hypothetical protein
LDFARWVDRGGWGRKGRNKEVREWKRSKEGEASGETDQRESLGVAKNRCETGLSLGIKKNFFFLGRRT